MLSTLFPLSLQHLRMKVITILTLLLTSCLIHATEPDDRLLGLIEPIKAEKPFKMGVAVVHLHDDFYKGIVYGITDEAKRAGVDVVQVSVAGEYGNVREQFSQLEALKSLGTDVAVLAPTAFNGFDPIIRSLKETGMKVASVGIPVNSSNIDFGVLQDDYSIGSVLADAVCEQEGDKTVATIPGPAGAEWIRLRYVGFTEQAEKCPSMTVLDGSFSGSLGLQEGLTKSSDLLLRNSDINYIYTPEISLGMGAAQAVRQQRRNVSIVSSSMVREAAPMIKDGRMLAVVSEPGIIMGRLIVQYAIREMEGKELPNLAPASETGLNYPHFNVPPTLINLNNVDEHPYEIFEIPPADWKIPVVN